MPSVEYMRLASLLYPPIEEMPEPATRAALRRAAGCRREDVATAIGASYISIGRAERGRSRLVNDARYRQLLGWWASLNPSVLGADKQAPERLSA